MEFLISIDRKIADNQATQKAIEEEIYEMAKAQITRLDEEKASLAALQKKRKAMIKREVYDFDNGMHMLDRYDLWLKECDPGEDNWVCARGPFRKQFIDCGDAYRHSTIHIDECIDDFMTYDLEIHDKTTYDAYDGDYDIDALLRNVIEMNLISFVYDW